MVLITQVHTARGSIADDSFTPGVERIEIVFLLFLVFVTFEVFDVFYINAGLFKTFNHLLPITVLPAGKRSTCMNAESKDTRLVATDTLFGV